MTKPKNFRHLLSVVIVAVSLGAPLRSEPKIPFGMPGDGTHRQSPLSTQVSKTALPAQSDLDQVSPTKSASLIAEKAAVKPPEVSYDQGQLTIVAENVPLSVVLDAVRRVMGADIEMPPGAANQLIWVRSGPGPARRVLCDLLDGTELDYVIQASETDVDGIRSVLLSARSKSSDTPEPGNYSAHAASHRSQSVVSPGDSSGTDVAPTENLASNGETAPSDPSAAVSAPPAPSNVRLPPLGAKATSSGSPDGNSEQMIQQLQTLYQQRRQMQMQQNQKLAGDN